MTRFALYLCLTKFFGDDHPIRGPRSARQPSSRLWLLPWHVPAVALMSHCDEARDVTEPNVPAEEKRTISALDFIVRTPAFAIAGVQIIKGKSAGRIEILNRIAR